MRHLPVEEVEGRDRRNVEQRARLEVSLDAAHHVEQRLVPVVGDVFVELLVVLLGHVIRGLHPDRFHRVERFRRRFIGALDLEKNRVGDEVRKTFDDLA